MSGKRARQVRLAVLSARQADRIQRSRLFVVPTGGAYGQTAIWLGERRAYQIAKRSAAGRPMPRPAAWFFEAVRKGQIPADMNLV